MKITVEMLMTNGACISQVMRFKKVFGESAEFNLQNIKKAVKHGIACNELEYIFENIPEIRDKWVGVCSSTEYDALFKVTENTEELRILWATTLLEEYKSWSKR